TADEISAKLLEQDGIKESDFKIPEKNTLKSRGEYRDSFKQIHDINYKIEEDIVVFEFSLEKGAYATVVLREYMKN
ncbi:MAG: tRNA pseudouridine(13) synthase TruD, partial [Candidatus Altiarchaeota archaeon]|nr:tRNA pseudouridine(13) synthase TruD [Candidatus Altiarchaeota archaeon]